MKMSPIFVAPSTVPCQELHRHRQIITTITVVVILNAYMTTIHYFTSKPSQLTNVFSNKSRQSANRFVIVVIYHMTPVPTNQSAPPDHVIAAGSEESDMTTF
jgi:hypothetical protein